MIQFHDLTGKTVVFADYHLTGLLTFMESLRYGTHMPYQSYQENTQRIGADVVQIPGLSRKFLCGYHQHTFYLSQTHVDALIVLFTHEKQRQDRELNAFFTSLLTA